MYSGIFERRKNNELQKLYNKPNNQFLKIKILECAIHVWRHRRMSHKQSYNWNTDWKKNSGETAPEMVWHDEKRLDKYKPQL